MTESTLEVIEKFANSGDFALLPSIIIGMQSEDNVSESIGVSNCFKILRNAAAHEPNTIIKAFNSVYNTGARKIVFIPSDTDNAWDVISFDIVDFIYWMHCMFEATKNVAYIRFIRALCYRLYPKYMSRFSSDKEFLCEDFGDTPSLRDYLRLQDSIFSEFGIPKQINMSDTYITSKFNEIPQLFWRVAVAYQSAEFALLMCSNYFTATRNNLHFVKVLYDVVLKKGDK